MTPVGIAAAGFALLAVTQQPVGTAHAVSSAVGQVFVFADNLGGDDGGGAYMQETPRRHHRG